MPTEKTESSFIQAPDGDEEKDMFLLDQTALLFQDLK